MDAIADQVQALHTDLIAQYDSTDMSNQAHDLFIDTLKEYTSIVALASTKAMCAMLGIPTDGIRLLDLTADQYAKLEASGMLSTYIEGKDDIDD